MWRPVANGVHLPSLIGRKKTIVIKIIKIWINVSSIISHLSYFDRRDGHCSAQFRLFRKLAADGQTGTSGQIGSWRYSAVVMEVMMMMVVVIVGSIVDTGRPRKCPGTSVQTTQMVVRRTGHGNGRMVVVVVQSDSIIQTGRGRRNQIRVRPCGQTIGRVGIFFIFATASRFGGRGTVWRRRSGTCGCCRRGESFISTVGRRRKQVRRQQLVSQQLAGNQLIAKQWIWDQLSVFEFGLQIIVQVVVIVGVIVGRKARIV